MSFGDAGYQGVEKRPEAGTRAVRWHVAMRAGKRRTQTSGCVADTRLGRLTEQMEALKASIRAKVEHPFHIIKNRFGLKRTRYKGLSKNTDQLFTRFGLANLFIAKKRLLGTA